MDSRTRFPYLAVCLAVGVVLAWVPSFFHGPIPQKFDLYYLNGAVMVWGWYLARMLIGLWVGITVAPRQWYLRGPLCGALAIVPLGFVSLGVPTCGPPCMFWNTFSASLIGLLVAGIAKGITGRSHAHDLPPAPPA